MMYYYNDYVPYHMFGFGYIFMILFWLLVLFGIFSLFKSRKFHHWHDGTDNAIKILKERYAKGEITKVEFESMKKDLE